MGTVFSFLRTAYQPIEHGDNEVIQIIKVHRGIMSSSISTKDRGVGEKKLPKNIEELLSKLKNDSTLKLNDTENYVLGVNNKMYDKMTISLSETNHSMESYAEEKSAIIQKSTEAKRKGMDQCTTTLKTLAEVQSKMNTLDTSKELTAFGRECNKQFLKEVTTFLPTLHHLYDLNPPSHSFSWTNYERKKDRRKKRRKGVGR